MACKLPRPSRKEMAEKSAAAPTGKKYCPCCDRTRALSFFPLTKGVPGSYCKTCRREAQHKAGLKRKFGITPEQYQAIYEAQNGKCAICQRATGKIKKLAVDHDHKTGKIRGLLCSVCNRMILGSLRDDIEALQRAIDYLKYPPAQLVLGDETPVIEFHNPSNRKKNPLLSEDDLRKLNE